MYTLLRAIILLCSLHIPVLAFGMIVTEGRGEVLSRKYGKNLTNSICYIKVKFDKSSPRSGTGVYIKSEKRKDFTVGTILTAAHLLSNPGNEIVSIRISFDANPKEVLERYRGTAYSIHPDYVKEKRFVLGKAEVFVSEEGKTKKAKGTDIAVIEFVLPAGSPISPMEVGFQLKDLSQKSYLGSASKSYFLSGYGLSAINREDQAWLVDAERLDVRRIAYTFATFVPDGKGKISRDSFESKVKLRSSKDFENVMSRKPFAFQVPDEPLFLGRDQFMGVGTQGDSGSPLFEYNERTNNFRVVGIYGSSYLDSEDLTSYISNWTALTPGVLKWVTDLTEKSFIKTREYKVFE